jgi:twitching motility protein PilT
MPKIDQLLELVKKADATDLHLVSGSVPMVRINGHLEKTRHRRLSDDDIRQLIYEILTDPQIRRFEQSGDIDLAYGVEGVARVRMNMYKSHTGLAAAVRLIPENPQNLEALGFAETVRQLTEAKSGLVLVTGPTNSGKTTTLAAMVDHTNTHFSRHIITLEDPIEYIYHNKNSLISQRQVGLHAESFASALRSALREDPDVVMVGEMRDIETISLAVTAAEIGLLVLGTLHTCSAAATVDRIIDVFPTDQQQQIRIMLADSLRGVVSQQLLRRADGHGRIAAYELMLQTTSLSSMIRERKTHQIPNTIQTSGKLGMQLLDHHLRTLVESGQVTAGEAAKAATDPSRFSELTTRENPIHAGV